MKATARACSNIAFVKYWGTADPALNLPFNGSISMNLASLTTETTVEFLDRPDDDELVLDGVPQSGEALARVSRHLDRIGARVEVDAAALVTSHNTFPAAAGLASSASGFAALTVAACGALRLDLAEAELSRLARLGSGSASRSIPGGFVEWHAGSDEESFAESLAAPHHWELWDVVALVEERQKEVSSVEGHRRASTSAFLDARLAGVPARLAAVRRSILERDFEALAAAAEEEALELHLVAMTSRPSILYWQPGTVQILQRVRRLRSEGLPVFYTLDAGANVHCLVPAGHQEVLRAELVALPLVERVLASPPGGPAQLLRAC